MSPIKAKDRRVSLLQRVWGRLGANRAPLLLLLMAGGAAIVMLVPVLYVLLTALGAGRETWWRLLNTRMPALAWNTGILALVVTGATSVVGTVLAFLVVRCDLPGRRYFRWLLAAPLAFPPYVGALSYIIVFGPRGWVRELTGVQPYSVYESLFSTALVLTMFCYPYVYLIVMSSLRSMSQNYEETALSCGLRYSRVLWKVVLPMLRPAIGAGALLTALYVVSDFGAVAMLRYNTFVRAIYYQMDGRFDRSAAAILSAVLILITLLLLRLERRGRRGRRYSSSSVERRGRRTIALKRWKIPALCFVWGVFALSVLLPLGVLGYWTVVGISQGALSGKFFGYMLNSLLVAGLVSFCCMAVTLPVVYIRSRYPSLLTRGIGEACFSGYALPGVIVALGVAVLFHRFIPWLYLTVTMVVFAHFMRFFPLGLGAGESELSRISPAVDEAARSQGMGPIGVIFRVILPLMLPGLLAGGALVFVTSLKELPATLLLRPPGFDTLPVRVWIEASEGFYAMAAPAALLLVMVAAVAVKLMLNRSL